MHASESVLERLEQYDLETSIPKDVNCDIAASPLDHQNIKFLGICNLYQFQQPIHSPTRKTVNTATEIDLFITNVRTVQINFLTLLSPILTLVPIIHLFTSKLCIPTRSSNIILSRQFNNFEPSCFRREFSLAPRHTVTCFNNPNST